MTPDEAVLALLVELRVRIDGLERVNAALTAENAELRKPRSRK